MTSQQSSDSSNSNSINASTTSDNNNANGNSAPLKPNLVPPHETPFSPSAHVKPPNAHQLFSNDGANSDTSNNSQQQSLNEERDLLVFDDDDDDDDQHETLPNENNCTAASGETQHQNAPAALIPLSNHSNGNSTSASQISDDPFLDTLSAPNSPLQKNNSQIPTISEYTIDPDDIFDTDLNLDLPPQSIPANSTQPNPQTDNSLFPTINSNQSFERIILLHPEFRKKNVSDSSFYSYKYLRSNSFANRYQFEKQPQQQIPDSSSLDSVTTTSTTMSNGSRSSVSFASPEHEDQLKREMRGIMYNHSKQKVTSRPFHKFFSVNENQESHETNIQKKMSSGQRYWLLEKLDGHMVLGFLWQGELRFRTQMSIDNSITNAVEELVYGSLQKLPPPAPDSPANTSSDSNDSQAETHFSPKRRFSIDEINKRISIKHFPTQDLNLYEGKNKKFLDFCVHWIEQDYSPIFEFFSKNHRVVINYDHDGLVLLSLRNNTTGQYMSYDQLVQTANKYDIPVVKQWTTTIRDVKQLLAHIKSKKGIEGYVLRFEDGDMYKIKTLWYTDMQKTRSFLKWNGILETYPWKLVLERHVDDAVSVLNTEAERNQLLKFNDDLLDAIEHASQRLMYIVNTAKQFSDDKKTFVEYVKENFSDEHAQFLSCVYEMYNSGPDTDPTSVLLKQLKQMAKKPDTCRAFLKSDIRFTLPEQKVLADEYMKHWKDEKNKVRQMVALAMRYLSDRDGVDYTAMEELLEGLNNINEEEYQADIDKVHFILEKFGWNPEDSQFNETPDSETLKAEFYSFLTKKDGVAPKTKVEVVNLERENTDTQIGDELFEHAEEKESEKRKQQIIEQQAQNEKTAEVAQKPSQPSDASPQQKKTPPSYANGTTGDTIDVGKSVQQPAHPAAKTPFSASPKSSESSATSLKRSTTNNISPKPQSARKSLADTADDSEYDDSEVTFDGESDYVTYGQEQKERLRQVNQYILGEKLGSGTYGKVVEAIDSKSLRRVAIKIMKRIRLKKIKGAEKRLKNEILINQKLKHTNVIEFYEVIHDEKKGKIYLVIEFAGAGSLSQVIDSQSNQRLPLPDVHHFFRQLVKGTEYIHSQGVVHLDIKPDNLMISPDRVLKISDFGVSHQFKLFEGDRCKNFFGTPTFACPQIARGDDFSGEKADIWACGITLYFLITGKYPFEGESVFQLYENIVKGAYEMPDYIPDDLKDILTKLLEQDENKRPSAAEIKKHPWYMGDDRESMRNKEPLVDRWRSFSLSQTISKALHNSNLYHMSFKVDGTAPSEMADLELDRDKCTIL
mmetsp:Transcript_4871/g.18268  ORF Transcript_4871/g.18268 Transcript_4871/m.18268 type:complete len:1298 (-) Transcript_4871:2929-6822(-)